MFNSTPALRSVRIRDSRPPQGEPAMSNIVDPHERVRVTSRWIEVNGRPVIPVSGELHYSRVPRERWEEELRLLVASGITMVSTYVFWIHPPVAERLGEQGNPADQVLDRMHHRVRERRSLQVDDDERNTLIECRGRHEAAPKVTTTLSAAPGVAASRKARSTSEKSIVSLTITAYFRQFAARSSVTSKISVG